MREIIFRGKVKSKDPVIAKRWVCGGLFFVGKRAFVVLDDCRILNCSDIGATEPNFYISDFVEVDPATVGQFTSWFGKDCYEGDIGKVKSSFFQKEFIGKIIFNEKNQRFEVRSNQGYGRGSPPLCRFKTGWDIEIVGNIFDNPELLK